MNSWWRSDATMLWVFVNIGSGNGLIPQAMLIFHSRDTNKYSSELTLGLRPANERRRYKVTPSLIGWVQT